jgi:hypothetical protein
MIPFLLRLSHSVTLAYPQTHLLTPWLNSPLKYISRLTYLRFLKLFRHLVGLLARVISPSQGLYLHRTAQHRKTRTNTHTLSGIRTNNPSDQTIKVHAPDRAATVTGGM